MSLAAGRLSSPSVSALFTKQPSQIKLSTLIALCTALECTPTDLDDVATRCHTTDFIEARPRSW
nr:helix-turn-helix transcriptional regulator [Mycobacterium intracellulare]